MSSLNFPDYALNKHIVFTLDTGARTMNSTATDSQPPAFSYHHATIRSESRHRRTHRVIMTNAARVLKEIREERKHKHGQCSYSMRAVSKRLSRSNAWLSHIENGRADVPNDHRLDTLLDIYGLKRKSFNERVRLYKQKITPRSELHELIDRLDADKVRLVLVFAKSVAGSV